MRLGRSAHQAQLVWIAVALREQLFLDDSETCCMQFDFKVLSSHDASPGEIGCVIDGDDVRAREVLKSGQGPEDAVGVQATTRVPRRKIDVRMRGHRFDDEKSGVT